LGPECAIKGPERKMIEGVGFGILLALTIHGDSIPAWKSLGKSSVLYSPVFFYYCHLNFTRKTEFQVLF
jgi:hypothetical protein